MAGPAGLRFTERMRGIVASGPTDNPFENTGGLGWKPFELDVDARIPDIDVFLRSEQHPIELVAGSVASGHFGRCRVTGGEINLMVAGRADFERVMRYRICFTTEDGAELTLLGFKDVEGNRLRMWYDTTRVFVELYRGTVADGEDRDRFPLVGAGVLEISALTFLVQMTTFRATGGKGLGPAAAYVRFMWFFSRSLVQPYLLGLFWRTKSDVDHARHRPGVEPLPTGAAASPERA